MRVAQRETADVMILEIVGNINGDLSMDLRRSLDGWLAEIPEGQEPKIVLNLSHTGMVDSAGLGVLVAFCTTVRKKKGRPVLCSLNRGMENLIAITKLSRVFDIYDNEEQALVSFKDETVGKISQKSFGQLYRESQT